MLSECSAEHLWRQTEPTVEGYLARAVSMVDAQFGEGFAKAHPQLVGQIVSAMASDFHTSLTCKTLEQTGFAVSNALGSIGDSLENLGAPVDNQGSSA